MLIDNDNRETQGKQSEIDHFFPAQLILAAIAKGAGTVEAIAQNCGGLYPLEILKILDELITQGQIKLSSSGYEVSSPDGIEDSSPYHFLNHHHQILDLPEPHPHDYDWRFDAPTIHRLTQTLVKEIPVRGTTLLLGTPSIFIEIARLPKPPSTIFLDQNRLLLSYLSHFQLSDLFTLVHHNLLSGCLWRADREVDIVLSDPPWYPEYYAAFLVQASQVTRMGGTVLISLLPVNTRPGAITDRWQIFEQAHKLGLDLQAIEPEVIRYKTPVFESTSLASSEINLQNNWRSSDLAIFKKTSQPSQEVVQGFLHSSRKQENDQEEWAEILFGCHKIKLRGPFNDYGVTPELISVEVDNILPTVSRRYPGRDSIDLWLWNNCVYAVRGKAAFLAALQTIAENPVPDDTFHVSSMYHDRALKLIQTVLNKYSFIG